MSTPELRTDPDLRSEPPEPCLATWWRQKTAGTTYWRCSIPAKYLPGQVCSLTTSDLTEPEPDRFEFPWQRGAAVWQFPANATRALCMAKMQDLGVKVLVEVDDNYLMPAPSLPGARGPGSDWSLTLDRMTDLHSVQAHKRIVPWVDGVIVSTDELAERYSRLNPEVFVCPNAADPDDWPLAEIEPERWRRIGYAASDSHMYDAALIDRALDWAWRQKGVKLVKLGLGSLAWRYPHEQVPWADSHEDYRRNLRQLHVGLCPLKRGPWADCKSDVKAVEYTLSGVLPLVQDAPPYAAWRGVVPTAKGPKQWQRIVRWAVKARWDELQDAWRQAYEFVLANRMIGQHIDEWRRAVA